MVQRVSQERKSKSVIIGTLATFALLCIYAVQLSVPVISDETTTMGNAAWIEGYDWSWMVASLGGAYYRYAQALMTVPFFKLLDDPAMIYRCSMILQALIQATIVPVVYIICQRHLHIKSKLFSVLLGISVCLVPSMALYTFYYRGDYLLGVLPWYVLLFLLETIKAYEARNRAARMIYTALTGVGCVLAYMSHTRGIVLSIAVIMSAIAIRIFWGKRSLHWPMLLVIMMVLAFVDMKTGQVLKNALYSISGLNANALESTDMGAYFNIFSYAMLKDLVMLCISWLCTLVTTTQGLVLIGTLVGLIILGKVVIFKFSEVTVEEKAVLVFALLVFIGYYAVGALFFKGTYLVLRTGELKKRVDRLLYDRYAICGAGMVIFVALYAICCRKEWIRWKEKLCSIILYVGILVLFVWKVFPTALRYKGYIYNTITLNSFNTVTDPANILSGEYYTRRGLLGALVLGVVLMLAVMAASSVRKKWMPYTVLGIVLVSDLFLIHVNFVKIRKASNDYVVEATTDMVQFMREFEDEVTDEFPYILKGGLSGIKIQFYQSQLMNYKMFGKDQEEQLGEDNYFIISAKDDIDLRWYEDDYYLFEDFDYEAAEYDIVYVKGKKLMQKMESLGYGMVKYQLQ